MNSIFDPLLNAFRTTNLTKTLYVEEGTYDISFQCIGEVPFGQNPKSFGFYTSNGTATSGDTSGGDIEFACGYASNSDGVITGGGVYIDAGDTEPRQDAIKADMYTLETGGVGYTNGDILSTEESPFSVQGARFLVSVDSNGTVTGTNMLYSGRDFTPSTTYQLYGGSGSGASISVDEVETRGNLIQGGDVSISAGDSYSTYKGGSINLITGTSVISGGDLNITLGSGGTYGDIVIDLGGTEYTGATGVFTSQDGKTITVTKGLITNIV